jgi:hypothetical protein
MLLLFSLIKDGNLPDIAIFIDGGNDTYQLHFCRDQPWYTPTVRQLWDNRRGLRSQQTRTDYSWIPMVRLTKGIAKRIFPKKSGDTNSPHAASKKERNSDNGKIKMQEEEPDDVTSYIISRYLANKRIIGAVCKEYGIQCYFIWQPVPFHKYDPSLHKRFPYKDKVPEYWGEVYAQMEQYVAPDFFISWRYATECD